MGKKRKAAAARGTERKRTPVPAAADPAAGLPQGASTGGVRAALGWLLLAPALLPLLFIPGFFFPYASSKTIGLRLLGILVLASLVWLLLARAPLYFGRLKQRATWIPAALLVVACVTSLLGVNFHHSLWSSFERGDGILTLAAEVLFFYAVLLHADAGFLRRLAIVSLWVSGAVSLYALVQWANVSLGMPVPQIMQPTDRVAADRIGATFGNAAFMASYLGMCLFLTLWIARQWRGGLRALAYAIVLVQMMAILASGTRGTIIALFLAGIMAAAQLAWHGKAATRLMARAVLAAGVLLVGCFLVFRSQLAHVPIGPVQRLATISPSSGTSAVRLVLWRSIGSEALHHPLTGLGAEHIDYAYNRAYSPDLISGQLNDRSHNVYLDYFVQFGIAGLLLYLALIVVALRHARAMSRAGEIAGNYLLLLIVTYAVQNFFVFDTAATLWLFMALLAAMQAGVGSVSQALSLPRMPVAVAAIPAAAILLLLVPVVVNPVRANLLIAKAAVNDVGDPEAESRAVEKGLALGTYADLEYGYGTYNMYAFQQEQTLTGAALLLAYRIARDTLARNLERYPYDVRTALYLAHVLDHTPAGEKPDMALLRKAADVVMRISPLRPTPWYYLANAEIRQGDAAADRAEKAAHYMAGITVLKQYAQMRPNVATPRFAIANLYLIMGDQAQARVWADAADAVYRFDIDAARAAAGFYVTAGDWPKVSRYLNEVVGNDMRDYPVALDLARARLLSGDRQGALALVEYLRKESPATLATAADLLAELEAH